MIPPEIDLPGGCAAAELITDRRGAQTWKVTQPDGTTLAVKYATGEARHHAQREAIVLKALDASGRLTASGETAQGSWLACPWWNDPTLAQRWKGVRKTNTPDDQAEALQATHSATIALAALHAHGWRHADLQAEHILTPPTGPAKLLDFALAQGPSPIEPTVIYRGGLAHLVAPETAEEILDTGPGHHVTVSNAAELYTFGAVLFAVWTRQWPHQYGSEQPSVHDIHRTIAHGEHRKPLPSTWPAMAAIIECILRARPDDRPTADELASTLAGMETP